MIKLKKILTEGRSPLNEINFDDKDGEILNIALQLAAKDMKKFRMSADEKKRLERLLKYFDLKYGDGRPYTDTSSSVDGMASQLDRR
jgi:hypothetical protein